MLSTCNHGHGAWCMCVHVNCVLHHNCREKSIPRAHICILDVFCRWLLLTCTISGSQINAHLLWEGNLQVVMWPPMMVAFMSATEQPHLSSGSRPASIHLQYHSEGPSSACQPSVAAISCSGNLSANDTSHLRPKIGGHTHGQRSLS